VKVGINGWRLQGRRTGVRRYLDNVLRYWTPEVCAGRFERLTLYRAQPSEVGDVSLPAAITERLLESRLPMLAWENLLLGPRAREDVLFQPSYSIPLIRHARTVVVSHDAVHELYPALFPKMVRYFYAPLYRWSARHATLVISDSQAGRQDVARTMGVPLSKIRVVQLAPEALFRQTPPEEVRLRILQKFLGREGPFFLFVGKLSGRRSISLLLEGFALFKRATRLPHRLVVIGLNIHDLDIERMLEELDIRAEVVYPGFISDAELNVFYHAAAGLISPSIYETACLPVMEAQAAGTVVICPDTDGMHEITGGHALLFPRPESPELARAIERLVLDGDLRCSLIEAGLEYSQQFSWERCSRETLDVLADAGQM